MQAIEQFAQGVAADPSSDVYKHRLIQIMRTLTFKKINENLKGVLLACLETPGLDLVDMGRCWLSIIESDENFSTAYKLSRHKDYAAFRAAFDRMGSTEVFQDAFFLTGLGLFIVPDAGFERWAMHLRRVLLESVTGRNPFDEQTREFLACALSRYCFLTDYIFEETEEEQTLVAALKKTIEKQAAEEIELVELAILGCYVPLYHLKRPGRLPRFYPVGIMSRRFPRGRLTIFYHGENPQGYF